MVGKLNNLHEDLVDVLTRLEKHMGFELTITSGYRKPAQNVKAGGVENSEHIQSPSTAADVLCKRSSTRYKMLKKLFEMGIRRIGIGNDFIHIGISQSHPQDVCWDYYPETAESETGRSTQRMA